MIDATGDVTGMNARKLSVLLLCACTLATLFALPAVAHAAYTTNAECLACHQAPGAGAVSTVDFTVASGTDGTSVDYTKCRACHWIDPATKTHGNFSHGYHIPGYVYPSGYRWGGTDCTTCHAGVVTGTGDLSRVMKNLTEFGWFATADPRSVSAAELHSIHVNGSWPKSVTFTGGCASCHESASCTACHSAPPAGHADHTWNEATKAYKYPPVDYVVGLGTPVTNPDLATATSISLTCVNSSCHSRAAIGTSAFTKPSCAPCHDDKTVAHGYDSTPHVADLSSQSQDGMACTACHSTDLMTEHAKRTSAGARSCATCHPSPRNTFGTWDKGCTQCHGVGTTPAKHTTMDAKHAGAASVECVTCHAGTLAAVHSIATTTTPSGTFTSCLACHNAATAATLPGKTCVSCHFSFNGHYSTAKHASTWTLGASCAGAGCHVAADADLQTVHNRFHAFTCAQCHSSSRPEVKAAITANQTACDACHVGASQTESHRAVHLAKPPLMSGTNPAVANYSYWTGSAGSAPTGDCIGCHTSNLVDEHMGVLEAGTWSRMPKKTSTGVTITCASCHASTDARVSLAITLQKSSCESCHTVHGPIDEIHASTYARVQPVPCADCHVSSLATLHNGTYSTTTLSGVTLRGCAVCHDYFEGARGATVQSAIAANDARCTACHAAAHPDLGGHTASASAKCAGCHKVGDVRPLHAGRVEGQCAVCHANSRVGTIATKTAECLSCHPAIDVSLAAHIAYTSSHVSTTTSCSGAGCHAIGDIAALHSTVTTTVAGVTYTACAVCHRSPTSQPTSSACTACHVGHGDLGAAHTAKASAACFACHENNDVRTLHKTKGCASCHGNPAVPILPANVECVNCHAALSPADSKHYEAASHLAVETGCSACHSLDMKTEHSKPTVSPAVTCVSCHEGKVDAFTSAWSKKCAACHATSHTAKAAKHTSANTTCAGSGCHVVTDVSVLHQKVIGGGCTICHTSPATVPTGKTDCGASGCHAGVGTNHHALHDASAAIDTGCKGCHFTYLDDEHAALGYSCATCHSSTNVAVKAAIANSVRACNACHPAVNGRNRHAAQDATQFSKGNSGGHRVYSTLPFMKTSFDVGSATYTWPTPAASAFLKTGWTTTSMVTCDKCHTFATTAAGAHGAAVKVNMDPAYPTDWKTVYLSSSGASSSTFICAKCHQNFGGMNNVHGDEDHAGSSDGKCIGCHSQVPHSWRLPRLLAYKDDPAPYNSLYLTGIALKSYTPSNWSESDCAQSGCGEHSSSMSNRWPSAVQTVGTLKGAVKTTAGVAIIGATVTTDKGQSATTDASGNYSLGAVATGTYNVTASASGYTAQTKAATLAADQTVSVDFALAAAPVSSNLALGKSFTASRTYNNSSTYAASKAGDDNTSTYWLSGSSSYGSYDWLRVDLGSSTSISKVEVAWSGTRYATEFLVYTSTDGSNWTQVYSTTSGGSGTRTVTFTARSARHVKVECRRAYSSSNGYGIAELRVFH